MATRLTRAERKGQTRSDLVAAARSVFLRRGFHEATLEEIAEEAGYTKGAVYSNFAGKDDLFLAVLDAHFDRRVEEWEVDLALDDSATFEETYRADDRKITETDRREPNWTPLMLEFWVHASRRDGLREQAAASRRRFLALMAGFVEEVARRHGIEYRLSPLEVARGSGALARGLAMERLLDPDAADLAPFEDMHAAYMIGLTKPPAAGAIIKEKR
jgi:AcrR family transcriptional regulator